MDSVVISPATGAEELAAAKQMVLEYAQELGIDLWFQDFARELREFPWEYASPRGSLMTARCGAFHCGVVALRSLARGDECEMKRLYVRRLYRGRGVGTSLVERALTVARALGYARVRLDTLASMQPAISLYEKLGFSDCAPYTYNPLPARFFERAL